MYMDKYIHFNLRCKEVKIKKEQIEMKMTNIFIVPHSNMSSLLTLSQKN